MADNNSDDLKEYGTGELTKNIDLFLFFMLRYLIYWSEYNE